MKRALWFFLALVFILSCTTPATALTQSVPETVMPQDASKIVTATPTVTPAAPGTTLYISATMHIESQPNSWPKDVDAYLAFIEHLTTAGIRLSIGADVGWLTNGVRVREIIERTSAMGIQWDVHAHKATDRAKTAYLLTQYGITPTSVISGMQISEFDMARRPSTYKGYTWTPQVVWGGVKCVAHRPGCDDTSIALYRPTSSAKYDLHDPNGNIVRVGNSDHQLASADELLTQITAGQYTVPVLSFTIMIEPETLQIVNSEDGLDAILAFAERMNQNPSVHFGTVEETAQAWVAAGSVPIQIP